MQERHYQIAGLLGFILAGSVVWIISCIIWLIPLLKS